jgi:hypothetical protein
LIGHDQGRLMDFIFSGRIQFDASLIGPTYPLRSVQTPNQAKTIFFSFCGVSPSEKEQSSEIKK